MHHRRTPEDFSGVFLLPIFERKKKKQRTTKKRNDEKDFYDRDLYSGPEL